MKSDKFGQIKEKLNFLKDKYDVVVYGSYVKGGVRPNSDIDIAVISHQSIKELNINLQKKILGKVPLKYELRVFELLPIHIQISIIENYRVVYGDLLEISEYFYKYRKKWDDCKYRILLNQFLNYKERVSLIRNKS
ncbi:MAG: nucleotidyltransferase domain-containing protein [Promethearchaeota archaeon]